MIKRRSIFITGTDTDVGKTAAVFVLGVLFQRKKIDLGIMKPVQCSGNDAQFLKQSLGIKDGIDEINPYFAKEPLSPHLAFQRQKTNVKISKIKENFDSLRKKHELVIVEGAGGIAVPIREDYFTYDLVRELDLDLVIVSRLGLGTINHTLLTIEQARIHGISVRGVIFNEIDKNRKGIPEKTNPEIIQQLSGVPVLGTIPHMTSLTRKQVEEKCLSAVCVSALLKNKKQISKKEIERDDKKYVWHPFTQMKSWEEENPLVIEEAKGSYLKDIYGRWYLDGVSSLWVNLHGHRHKAIDKAVISQIKKVSHSTLLGLSNVPAVELAKRLVSIAPKGLKKVFYSDSGSTSVEIAIKMAYQYWQNMNKKNKRRIIHFAHSYHGDTLGSVSVGGINLFHKVYKHLIFKAMKWPTPYPSPFLGKKKYEEDFFKAINNLEKFLKKSHGTTAAIIVEPLVQGAAGMIVWPKGILKQLFRIARKYDVLLIADEVATGFGRTGKMFACLHEKIVPDILCLAKGITAGYLPLAATLTTQKIYDGFLFPYKEQKTFFHGHTYTGNPLACAVALANIDIFEREKTIEKLSRKIAFLKKELKKFNHLTHVGDVRQKGFMIGIELVKDKKEKKEYSWQEEIGVKVCRQSREKGIILRPLGNVIVLMPPLSISFSDLQKLLRLTYQTIYEVTQNYGS